MVSFRRYIRVYVTSKLLRRRLIMNATAAFRICICFLIGSLFCFNHSAYIRSLVTLDFGSLVGTMPSTGKTKRILFWTSMYGRQGVEYTWDQFQVCETLYKDCELTTNRSLITSSNAVIMHMFDVKTLQDIPKFRLPSQKWVYFNREPPLLTPHVTLFDDVFNVTMSYRHDSDVYDPYGFKIEYSFAEQRKQYYGAKYQNFHKNKNKMMAWFVSSCSARSRRQEYFEELRAYVPIDVYGKCGNMSCEKGSMGCYEMLQRDYKFYFAAENSLCKDYLTEKVWLALRYDVIPVVLGEVDYQKFLPEGSYIDVRNFANPKALADYLFKVGNDSVLYNSYFKYKTKYKVVPRYQLLPFCKLCDYLHKSVSKTYSHVNLAEWWDTCTDPRDFYKTIATTIH